MIGLEMLVDIILDLKIPYRQESKARLFFTTIINNVKDKKTVRSCSKFIICGPILETFQKWNLSVRNTFTNRTVVEHGKHDDSINSEENTIKLFLLLDTFL